MNEAEKKTITEAADSLALLALGLRNGYYRSAADIASAIDRHVGQLRQARAGDKGLCASASLREKIDPAAPTPKRGLVGIISNKRNVLAWSYEDGLCVRVMAHELKPELWQLRLESGGSLRMLATVFGGRGTANRLCSYVRNGMVSRAMKLKHNPNRRAAKA